MYVLHLHVDVNVNLCTFASEHACVCEFGFVCANGNVHEMFLYKYLCMPIEFVHANVSVCAHVNAYVNVCANLCMYVFVTVHVVVNVHENGFVIVHVYVHAAVYLQMKRFD